MTEQEIRNKMCALREQIEHENSDATESRHIILFTKAILKDPEMAKVFMQDLVEALYENKLDDLDARTASRN
jgi:hypothetical protein